jgi:hypothetical protein
MMTTREHEIVLTFPQCSAGEGNRLAVELQELLSRVAVARGVHGYIRARIAKDDNQQQDFGATLAIIFGTPAAIAIAKGIHDFIAAKGHAVTIHTKEGTVIATGDAAKNIEIAETVNALSKR